LTLSSTLGGHVTSPGEGTFTYFKGQVVNIVATSDSGYKFDRWNLGVVTNPHNASTTITMNDNYTVPAYFLSLPIYTLNLSSSYGGHVTTPGEGVYTYYEGGVINITATASPGYQFSYWSGEGFETGINYLNASITITMGCNKKMTANFVSTVTPTPPTRTPTPTPVYIPPVITSLLANPAVVSLGNESVITCAAVGYNGRPLSYYWGIGYACKTTQLGVGNISGYGNVVDWIPSVTGEFTIWVGVTDQGLSGWMSGNYVCATINVWCK
jgi:hypothetical protein